MNLLLEGEKSERLSFRKITPSDFDSWLPFHQDPRSTQYWEGVKEAPLESCKTQFKSIFQRYDAGLGGMNALIDSNSNNLVGICGLLIQTVDEQTEIEIGYSIVPKFWKKGYATEAAKKCKDFAKKHAVATSVISIIHVNNIPSQNVALKNGMFLDKTTTYKNNPVHIYRVAL